MTKFCPYCQKDKSLDCFYKRSFSKDGFKNKCKKCVSDRNKERGQERYLLFKEWASKNKDKIRVSRTRYYQKNREKILSQRKKNRASNLQKHREIRNSYDRKKIDSDVNYKLAKNLRNRMRMAIKRRYKSGSAVRDLGCSIDFLKIYLESKFLDGMSWDNWSKTGWHIDHIIPLSSFDLTNRIDFLKACHYSNLQPLWATDNLSKGDFLTLSETR